MPPPATEKQQDKFFSQNYIDRLERLCYAQLQRKVGETRIGRGIIWTECMYEYVRPVEKEKYADKAYEIDRMYYALLDDMKKFYRGQTTSKLLHQRWIRRQQAIGYEKIRQFKDTY